MRGNLFWKFSAAIMVPFFLAAAAMAGVKPAGVFGDHMVLQCNVALPVWGWAEPGESVTVTVGDQSKTATADSKGKWSVKLNALQAGGPLTMTIKGRTDTVKLSDVLVGEVWLCSGQSNMEMTVGGVMNKDAEIAAANYPKIRMYSIDHIPAKDPVAQRNGRWFVCSPQSVAGFSAAGYFFGRELHKRLGTPVGLINSSWGGTPIETWTSVKAHEAVPELKSKIDGLNSQTEAYLSGKAKTQYEKQLAEWEKAADAAKAQGKRFATQKPQPPQDPRLSPWAPAASTTV